jgi:F0F1-type ATP synthase assembly protein I
MDEKDRGFSGVGPRIAVASELPCSVISLLLVGQILGASFFGSSGAIWGAILGALIGFFLGVYGVYKTIGYLEIIEQKSQEKPHYMPPMEDILEDVVFDLEDESPE